MHTFSKLHIDFQKSPHFVLYVQCVSVCELYLHLKARIPIPYSTVKHSRSIKKKLTRNRGGSQDFL